MTANTQSRHVRVPDSTVHLARALVADTKRHGQQEDPRIVEVAQIPLPGDKTS